MADGSIRIETKLDNSRLKQQIKELERELKNIQKEQAKVDAQMDGAMARYQAELEFDSQFPEEFSHREEIDARAAKELDPIIAKQEELNQKEQQYLAMLDAAKAKLAEQANLANASKQVDDAVKSDPTGKVQSQAQYNSLLDATAAKMAAIEAAAGRVAAQTGLTKEQILAANPQYQKLSATMGMLKSKAADFGNEAGNAGKKTDKAMKRAEKSTKRVNSETKRGIAGFGKMQLAMMGIMMATRAISAATQEYMATNTKLEGQINTLKSLWGQVLGPVIEWVINLFIKAISAVNAFVYALTGINFIARANEAALKKQAKAAKSAQGASFDEQTKIGDSSGSNNPVTLLDASVNNISEKLRKLVEDKDWYEVGKYLGESLMEFMENADWVGIGEAIGKFLGGVIAGVLGFAVSLDIETINGAINGFVGGLLQGLSEELQKVDWVEVGGKILEVFLWGLAMHNPMLAILSVLLSPNGDELVSGAAEFIGTIIGALLQALIGVGFRLGELAAELWNGIKGYFDDYVDWEGTPDEIIGGLWDGIKAAASGVGAWIEENIWNPFVKGFTDCIDWESPAGELIAGLYEGIKSALSDIGTWIHDNIWVPFRDWFCEAFDIHSPSKKMEDFGGNIIDGLYNGITGAIDKIKQACSDVWTAIQEKFNGVGDWFKETFSGAWEKVKEVFSKGGETWEGIKEGISTTFKNIVNGLIDGINSIIRVPFNKINGMLNTIRAINVLGVEPFKGLWSYNPLSVPQIPKLALGGIVNRPGRGVPAIIGEAGAEAVLPLENNTEWMDILADKIGGGTITIPITLDGKKIATYVVDIQKKKAFAMNGA